MVRLMLPFTKEKINKLKCGEEVFLNGLIYTARDRAHERLVDCIEKGRRLPFDVRNQIIYYCGPIIQANRLTSCGPTTSSRMDIFMEPLLNAGLRATIGKGKRHNYVRTFCKKYKSVYFLTHGGCGAYLRKCIKSFKLVALRELGPEAIYEFTVEDFPLIVGIDSSGNDIYSDRMP